MSDKTLDSEALEKVINYLYLYIDDVKKNVNDMLHAACDCVESMDGDNYSRAAWREINKCASELRKNLQEAEELRFKIIEKKNEIEESEKILD